MVHTKCCIRLAVSSFHRSVPSGIIHTVRAPPGFLADVDEQLIEAAKLSTCEEFQKYIVLVMNEMHIKEDLMYDKYSGELVGFVNLGEMNNLNQFE